MRGGAGAHKLEVSFILEHGWFLLLAAWDLPLLFFRGTLSELGLCLLLIFFAVGFVFARGSWSVSSVVLAGFRLWLLFFAVGFLSGTASSLVSAFVSVSSGTVTA